MIIISNLTTIFKIFSILLLFGIIIIVFLFVESYKGKPLTLGVLRNELALGTGVDAGAYNSCRYDCSKNYDNCTKIVDDETAACKSGLKWWQIREGFRCDYAMNDDLRLCIGLFNECVERCNSS